MFDPTYQQLAEKGFEPTRLSKNNESFPEYMKLYKEDVLIITAHIGGGEYSIHRLNNRYGRNYSPNEISSLKRFEDLNSLDELIDFLMKDEEQCELNPPY